MQVPSAGTRPSRTRRNDVARAPFVRNSEFGRTCPYAGHEPDGSTTGDGQPEIGTKRAAVARAVKARQDAYDDAAKLAEKHAAASGNPGEADRLRTAIAAIPRIELVLARVGQVTAAATLPGYDASAGLAYAVAKKGKGFPVGALDQAVGAVKGYKQELDGEHGKWQGRLDSAKKLAAGLNVSGT